MRLKKGEIGVGFLRGEGDGILEAMKFDPFLSDEPSIAPPTPGAVLVRLSQTLGALRESCERDAAPKASSVPSLIENLASARGRLLEAIEKREKLGTVFHHAQNSLRELYKNIAETSENDDARAENLVALGFPDPRLAASERVLPVDLNSLVATHFKPEKQVFTTLSFGESHGTTAYWLLEVRYFEDQRLVDGVVENYAPQFSRVRLPVGIHHFIIESRNAHYTARTEEFSLEVPAL